jgi:hypothetical protein
MKKTFFCFTLLLFFSGIASGQFYIVSDTDGYVNVRAQASINARGIYKLNNDEIVYKDEFEEDESNKWMHIFFFVPGATSAKDAERNYVTEVIGKVKIMEGYIYKDRLLPVEKLKAFNKKVTGENVIKLKLDSVSIIVKTGPFEKKKHRLKYNTGDGKYLTSIDGHSIVGSDGGIPGNEITDFRCNAGRVNINMPVNAYIDLYEPNLSMMEAYSDNKGYIYIVMHNSDAAGSYIVIFVIRKNKYYKRAVFLNGA